MTTWLASFILDLSTIQRRLRRRPGDFFIAAATLAVVIGVGGAVFAVVNGTMLRPLPFPDQDRLVRVFTMPPGAIEPDFPSTSPTCVCQSSAKAAPAPPTRRAVSASVCKRTLIVILPQPLRA